MTQVLPTNEAIAMYDPNGIRIRSDYAVLARHAIRIGMPHELTAQPGCVYPALRPDKSIIIGNNEVERTAVIRGLSQMFHDYEGRNYGQTTQVIDPITRDLIGIQVLAIEDVRAQKVSHLLEAVEDVSVALARLAIDGYIIDGPARVSS